MAHKVHTLMAHKARHHGQHGHRPVVQAEDALQLFLAGQLVRLEIGRRIVFGKVRVCGRVVAFGVDAVQNAAQLVLLLPQQAVQPMAVPWVQYFCGITGRNGSHLVGTLDGALHEVHTAVILQQMRVCMADAQGILHNIHAVFALILDIVDGEHRFDAAVRFQVPVIQVQIHGHQRRLPSGWKSI